MDQVSGQGTTVNETEYEKIFTDLGNSKYIRLSQTDYDGSKTVLGLASINCVNQEIQIFPNPTTGNITIKNVPKNAFISISNMQGQVVLDLRNDSNETLLNLDQLSGGTYFITIKGKLSTEHYKVVKK